MRDQVSAQLLEKSSSNAIKETLDKMNAKIESAKRKMEMHSVAIKRESKEFNESDYKPTSY